MNTNQLDTEFQYKGNSPEVERLLTLARQDTASSDQLDAVRAALALSVATLVTPPDASACELGHTAEGPACNRADPTPSTGPAKLGPTPVDSSLAASVLGKIGLGVLTAGAVVWWQLGHTPQPQAVLSSPPVAATAQPSTQAAPHSANPTGSTSSVEPMGAPSSGLSAPQPAQGATNPVLTDTDGRDRQPRAELSLLKQAQGALAGSPETTLALCRKHARLYPQGQLSQEREVLTIEALRRLGRQSEARQLQREFAEQYPGSAMQRRVSDQPLPTNSP